MNLLQIEFRKIFLYRTFWVILGIYALLLLLSIYVSKSVLISGQTVGASMFEFPGLWARFSFIAYFFNLLLGILIIVLITDEYSFRTFRQQVIDGLSRKELVLAKFCVALGLAVFSTVFLLALGLIFGLLFSKDKSFSAVLGQIDHLSYFFVQSVGYMTLAMFFAFLVRKSGLAIIAYLAWAKLVEPIIHYQLDDSLDKYMPIKVFGSLTPTPGQEIIDQLTSPTQALSPAWAVLPALGYIGLLLLGSYLLLRFRDL
ncbi:ABC transporter permease [Pontibacter sp. JH31]|uniref:ABC transporter permease n=1 Tax=Pontibacter aquaedesilientis TaxID=2766980 RepID=A0ABR7XFA9_9BACT|nr:ABC transporter permease [Pontibacter aquaedesilientis]MBD1396974.1 ABC transporter permease [Pontibacter aquaedesilientis]